MSNFEIIKCHGSGNDFIMVDVTRLSEGDTIDWSTFARIACDRTTGIGSDGVLLVVRNNDGIYGMDMLNPDGTHAEMCGNGIRCVARLATDRGYLEAGVLSSGGRTFPTRHAEPIAEGVEAFAVEIPISTWSESFGFFNADDTFVGKTIANLDSKLPFTALNLGNPHVVAVVDKIDMAHLEVLGERVKSLKHEFPHGVNVSLYEVLSPRSIFVATYERGAGITLSCGTAMTASATAAALLGHIATDERIEVFNRGGKVVCSTHIDKSIVTTLEGNATFEWFGTAEFDGTTLHYDITHHTGEAECWQRFVDSIQSNR
ncbi:MAG: diaminopimelate epimerase [Alistipes sp.]|nr:diaminopimelate epimerase [Alistipes sp.]